MFAQQNQQSFNQINNHQSATDSLKDEPVQEKIDQDQQKQQKQRAEQETQNLWQHPYVDVFKHFKVLPDGNWKQNKKQGQVDEYFAKEIGRRVISIEGQISAINQITIPDPLGPLKMLQLTGRYIYLQVKVPRYSQPFSYNIDLVLHKRSSVIRISISNLYKTFQNSNEFIIQVPFELKNNCWTVAVFDIYDILKKSSILPPTYLIDGSYSIRSINICANTHIRGIFTSDKLYDFVTIPSDMRFKFTFELQKWPENFDWQIIPQDWKTNKNNRSASLGLGTKFFSKETRQQMQINAKEEAKLKMKDEIDQLLGKAPKQQEITFENQSQDKSFRGGTSQSQNQQQQLNIRFQDSQSQDGDYQNQQNTAASRLGLQRQQTSTAMGSEYRAGMFNGLEISRSPKFHTDPIFELKHIIGYQANKCQDIRWSNEPQENAVIFTTGGTLISQDAETNEQIRFFFGHTTPICCFDVNKQGNMMASAQEGKDSIIRIWDYRSARCISIIPIQKFQVKYLNFSSDGQYLVSQSEFKYKTRIVMKNPDRKYEKEICQQQITIWDVSGVLQGYKPQMIANQTNDFHMNQIKFSPIDSSRLASCGKEDIRMWRVQGTGNIRGKAVILGKHARDSEFTCLDYEHDFNSNDQTIKHILFGSKHGKVFVVDYEKGILLATYKTNESSITSLAANKNFCVIGSEDTYLRFWPLDFQEFSIEAQHEGTVSALDIHPDGLKVVSGTLYGSIGILDKSNINYRNLCRSHTDEVLAMEFHKLKSIIITVSRDQTIRLWDSNLLEEVYEFQSLIDQPLCIAAHPTLPIFACGFQSGKMSIFDIQSTKAIDEFSQFDKPLEALKYDNFGKILVTCAQGGSVAIHNALRQHLPIQTMNLDLAPEFLYVSFSENIGVDCDQKFALVGEHGNNVVVYETDSFLVQHKIQIENIVRSFRFSNNNQDLIVVTKDCRIRFYSLTKFEGIFLREIQNCHRGAISALDISSNSGFMITGGQDNLINLWDYDAQKTDPYYFQSFVGHIYPIQAVIFNPNDNSQVFTMSEHDGIFVWQFFGDTQTNYATANLAGQDLSNRTKKDEQKHNELLQSFSERIHDGVNTAIVDKITDHIKDKLQKSFEQTINQHNILEKMRTHFKAKKNFRNQMSEDSFIIPSFCKMEQIQNQQNQNQIFDESPIFVAQQRDDRKLTYNHYANCSKKINVTLEHSPMLININPQGQSTQSLEPKIINGYDGFGGVHDNIIWNPMLGFIYFTLNNKFISENTKTRDQVIFADSLVQLSCISASSDFKYIACGEGSSNPQNQSFILLYEIEKKRPPSKLKFHQKGIQSLSFTYDTRYLMSLGVYSDNTLAIWDLSSCQVLKSHSLNSITTNQIKVVPFLDSPNIQFFTCGNHASLSLWEFDVQQKQLTKSEVEMPEYIRDIHYLCLEFSDILPDPVNTYLLVIGASDGTIIGYNKKEKELVQLGHRNRIVEGQIGVVSLKNNSLVLASSRGLIFNYPIYGSSIQPDDMGYLDPIQVDSAVISISMDTDNNEGVVGTESGSIYYINLAERTYQKLVSSNNKNHDAIKCLKMDPTMTKTFYVSCGQRSEELKIFTNGNLEEVYNFKSNFDDDGYVVFVIQPSGMFTKFKKQKRLIGFSNGVIKQINLESLTVEQVYSVPLRPAEKLTCGVFSENDVNFAFGTNQGTLFFGSFQRITSNKFQLLYCKIENVGRVNIEGDDKETKKFKTHHRLTSDLFVDNQSLDIDRQDSQMDLLDFTGISNIQFPFLEHVQKILITFDDGTIRLWQSTVNNEQNMKVLELQQVNKKKFPQLKPQYDLAAVGYQQFDLIDYFDIFQNPEGIEDITDADRHQLKTQYGGKKYPNCQARFNPGPDTNMRNYYFCFVDSLDYLYIRDYVLHQTTRSIPLNAFPTCMAMIDFKDININPESQFKDGNVSRGNFLVTIGTKQGTLLVYKVANKSHQKLFQTKSGISYGEISGIELTTDGETMIATTQTGEILKYELLKKMNESVDQN